VPNRTGRIRLIVLGEVSEEGLIPERVVVYKVTSSLTAEDYHKNVGKEEFTKRFDNLAKVPIIRILQLCQHDTRKNWTTSNNKVWYTEVELKRRICCRTNPLGEIL